MNENSKTMIFVAVAVLVAGVAWLARPSLPVEEPEDMRGQQLFPDFQDPLAAASLEIVKFDETTATVRPFEVAQVDGRWSIPSHDDYPADAEDQVADAAASMMELTALDVASDSPGDHSLYGVVDPDPKTLKAGSTGVGIRVIMKDKDKKVLMSLIIGKTVPDRDELHYVRRAGQDPVYTVAVKTEKLSTKFEDWIEDDLLKLSSFDIKQVDLRNHSVDEMQGALIQRGELSFDYNDTGDPKWKLVEDRQFKEGKWVPGKLADDEELNTAKLDEMKTSLDDLKIVDVATKPAGLSADLKAAKEFSANREAVASLASRGFYVAKVANRVELFSNEGEVRCLMKDGVEYVLRFGEIAAGSGSQDDKEKDEKGKPEEDGKESGGSGLNRYIFVMAEFNPGAIEQPKLESLPEAKKPAEKKPEADKKPEANKKPEADKKPEAEKKPEGEKKPEAEKPEAEKPEMSDEELAKERERIEKDNKRKQEEYDEKVAKGKERVKELNGRFADWYYIISDEVYRKIHLSRADVVKKKEAEKKDDAAAAPGGMPPAGVAPGAFDALRKSMPGMPPAKK